MSEQLSRKAALEWLHDFLNDQDSRCESAEIKREGRKAGHSADALKRARQRCREYARELDAREDSVALLIWFVVVVFFLSVILLPYAPIGYKLVSWVAGYGLATFVWLALFSE